jgi:hypothetical protein
MRKQIRLGVACVDPHGDPEGSVGNPEALACHASLVLLVKQAADLLEKHYPGWGWLLGPDEAGGVINIQAMLLSGSWGYTLKIKDLHCDPQLRKVLKVGGELLERFGYKAGPFDRDAYQHGPRHLGLPVADTSDLKPHERRSYRTQSIKQAVEQGRARILTDSNIAAARSARRT